MTIGSTSAVSLGSNLKLVTNNGEIEAGATFSGAGALIVPAGSHLIPDAGANINVLLDVEGPFVPPALIPSAARRSRTTNNPALVC